MTAAPIGGPLVEFVVRSVQKGLGTLIDQLTLLGAEPGFSARPVSGWAPDLSNAEWGSEWGSKAEGGKPSDRRVRKAQ